jgi:hypothetical protein
LGWIEDQNPLAGQYLELGNSNFAEVGIGAPNLIPNRVEIILLKLGQGGPSSFNFGFQAKSLPARAIEESVLKRLREAQPARFGASEWEQMDRNRQVEATHAIVERVGYDGRARQISIRLRPVPIPGEEVPA